MTNDEAWDAIGRLYDLTDDWDGEGAPRPSLRVLKRTDEVFAWAYKNGLSFADVDSDVMGGSSIYLSQGTRNVWLAIMNSGIITAVMSDDDSVRSHCVFSLSDADSQQKVIGFLRGE